MRKKYLSALLFGALLVTSAGTFTSCKDYDDDINNLQEQITANADAIKALQDLVNAGKYVSGVAMEGQTITFTFSDGSTQPITIPAGEKGQTVVVKDGELYIDDEPTGIKVAEELETEAGLVKSENGTWWVLNENGEYTNTNIPVSGVTVSGSEKDGYTFTIYNEKGEAQTVKLPTVASSITSVSLATASATNRTFNIAAQEFKFNRNNSSIKSRSDWKGSKALPNDGDWVLSSTSAFDVRIDPVSADISNVDFYLTNTKNTDLSEVVLKATAENSDEPLTGTNGRAANIGNGLWTLTMPNTVVADATYGDANSGVCKEFNTVDTEGYVYALNAGHSCRSLYEFTVENVAAPVLSKVVFTQSGNGSVTTASLADEVIAKTAWTVKVGVPVKVTGDQNSDVYDIYLEVAAEDAKYKVTFDQENHTFTIGQNPDWSTRDVQLPVIVWTIDNDGNINKTKVTVTLNSEFSTDVNYEAVTHNIAVSSDKNVKYIDLQKMKDGFQSQDDLDSWIKNVSFTTTDYVVYSDEQCKTQVASSAKLTIETVEKQDINVAALNGIKGASANYVRIKVDNTKDDNLKLDTKYYVKATYKDKDGNILNSIVIPITFTAPTVAEQFAVSTNYQNGTENSIKAFYNNWEVNFRNINLVTYFKAYDKYATLSLDDDAVITKYNGDDKDSEDLADLTNDKVETGYITLNDALKLDDGTNREAGYGQALKVNVVNSKYTDTKWAYSNEADTKYSFTISVFSPIFEGTIAATDGSKNLTVIANSEDGSDITADMVKLTDYANNKYNVVPDDFGNAYNNKDNKDNKDGNLTGDDIWSAKQIENVWVEETGDNNYIKEIKLRGLQLAGENVIPGAITVIAQPVPSYTEPTEVTVNVKDVWGYITSQPLNITLTPNSEN